MIPTAGYNSHLALEHILKCFYIHTMYMYIYRAHTVRCPYLIKEVTATIRDRPLKGKVGECNAVCHLEV